MHQKMFNLELGGIGDAHIITPDLVKLSIETLDAKQQDFLNRCLEKDPLKRPNAKELLFHPLLFEVPSLRLLAAHQIVRMQQNDSQDSGGGEINNSERIFNDSDFRREPDFVIASTNRLLFNNNNALNNSTNISSDGGGGHLPVLLAQSNINRNFQNSNNSLSSSASNSTSSSSNSLSSSSTG